MSAGEGNSFKPDRRISKKAKDRAYLWFQRNQSKLLATDFVCIVVLVFIHLYPSTSQFFIGQNVDVLQIAAIALVCPIALSVVWKGIVPVVICVLGIVLLHNSVILPYYSEPQPGEALIGEVTFRWTLYTPTAVSMAANMNFFLGVSMVILSIIIAYRPSLLFTRNRPDAAETEWLKYPLWHDNTLLADGRTEYSIPIKRLMTEQDRYVLWRYEYILASIYGTPHLVKPEGYVPKYSTNIYRDPQSGRIIGKARYNGFFV
jgi:hypothetical protein